METGADIGKNMEAWDATEIRDIGPGWRKYRYWRWYEKCGKWCYPYYSYHSCRYGGVNHVKRSFFDNETVNLYKCPCCWYRGNVSTVSR